MRTNKNAIIGISIGASACVALILVIIIAGLPSGGTPYHNTLPLTINGGDWDQAGATLYQDDRWVVDFTSTTSVQAYLMTWDQFNYFYNYGSVSGYLDTEQGTSGHFDFTQPSVCSGSSCNVVIVFRASSYAEVTVDSTEYHM
nr:hypothetical protein [Candidatus Sigynarchaeota archaeon]